MPEELAEYYKKECEKYFQEYLNLVRIRTAFLTLWEFKDTYRTKKDLEEAIEGLFDWIGWREEDEQI